MRLIDADELNFTCVYTSRCTGSGEKCEKCADYVCDFKEIQDAPTVEAKPVIHGEWIGKPLGGYSTVRCSNCKNVFLENQGKWNFCPDCGADMRKKVQE